MFRHRDAGRYFDMGSVTTTSPLRHIALAIYAHVIEADELAAAKI
jgi:hypothetical protein